MTKEEIQQLLDHSIRTKGAQSEEALEFSSMLQFHDLGWQCEYALHEEENSSFLGRKDFTEVVLDKYLKPKLKNLNSDKPDQAIEKAIEILKSDRSVKQTVNANREIYQAIKGGVKVTYLDDNGQQQTDRIQVVDWKRPSNNHFLIVSQFQIKGSMGLKRPDLIGFLNGLPVLFIEYKASDVSVKHAFDDNLTDYKAKIPHLLWYNALCILSNGIDAKIGSITAGWEHFADWKKISAESEPGVIDLNTMISGTCEHQRFMDIIENFIVYLDIQGGVAKIVSKNHQYLGVNNAIKAIHQVQENEGKLGVFWHTQGSGKSISMIFFCQKVLRKIPGNWTFVIITDRNELDTQIYKNFENANVVNEARVHATSTKHLRKLLSEDHRYIFSLIHKFQTDDGSEHPVLSERKDIVVITDEAHRSQYDLLAQNMRTALPNAAFLGFTGTPLISHEQQKTREVFGEYVSIYNFSQSIEDGATVPLYYENRIPELQLNNEEHFTEELHEIIEESMLDEDQESKLQRQFSSMYQLITRDDRLEKIAEDLVEHYVGRGHRGKAMVICIDRATAVIMYDKVQKYFKAYLNELKEKLDNASEDERDAFQDIYDYSSETDMAVVVSSGQNEVAIVEARGADIRPHRKRMINEDLEKKFKDPDDPFRIVFVCSMWITGFDVPSCSTMYLDKPMKNHTLMQTIARANRVFPDKNNGLIVDYVGVFRNLEKALAIYGDPKGGGDPPVKDKDALKLELEECINELMKFLSTKSIDLDLMRACKDISQRLAMFKQARDSLVQDDQTKKEYLKLAQQVRKIYKSYLPDHPGKDSSERAYLVRKLAKAVKSLDPEIDIDDVLDKVEDLLDRSIEGFRIEVSGEDNLYDLSLIDFDVLKKRFEKGDKKRTEVEILKNELKRKIAHLSKVNKTRMDYLEKLNEMIAEYNQGAQSVEEIFQRLIELAQQLKKEEKRYIKEELSNEKELAIFDLLTKPDPELTDRQMKEVKAVARNLYNKLAEGMLVLDWRNKQETKSRVKVAIKQELDGGLPDVYDTDLFNRKWSSVYDYVWETM